MNVPAPERLQRYLSVTLRWLSITAIVFTLTIFAGAYITDTFFDKVYTATAEIQIRPQGVRMASSGNGGGDVLTNFQAEVEVMQSPDFLLPIIVDLGLDEAWASRVSESKEDALTPTEALAYMNKIVKIEVLRQTNLVNITVSSDVPLEAARIANAIADRYKMMRDVEEDQRSNRGTDSLRDQIAQQQKVVDDAKTALEKIKGDRSPAFHDAQQALDKDQAILDALNIRLKQVLADQALEESPVRIISRAEVPAEPSSPNKSFDFVVTLVVAALLSITVASFTEIVLLFIRAGERTDNNS